MKQNRVHVRLPDPLANHVAEMCGEGGLYDNASEFFRDLARQHYEKIEQGKILKLNAKLAPLLNRPIEECLPFEPEKDLAEMKQRYLAKKDAKNEGR